MSIRVTKGEIVKLLKGTIEVEYSGTAANGLEMDCRLIKGGELFVALPGEQAHGHRYVADAYARGAALFLVESISEALEGLPPDQCPEVWRFIEVEDSLKAFWKLATWWRQELTVPCVAITGSMGKTTTKELLAAILLASGRGAYSRKSFNNHTGVPYSVCSLGREHEWGVFEIGMNNAGEISNLIPIIAPDVAVITCVAPVHIQGLGSIEAIADAKSEIIEGLKPGGVLITYGDDEVLQAGVERCCTRLGLGSDVIRPYSFGRGSNCTLQIKSLNSLGEKGISLSGMVRLPSGFESEFSLSVPILGIHNGFNVAAAVLAALILKPQLTLEQIQVALSRFTTPPGRLEVVRLDDGRSVVNDAYNASPEAMRALFGLCKEFQGAGRQVGLVLGDMLELGAEAEHFHKSIAEEAAALRPMFVVGVGAFAETYAAEARKAGVASFAAASPEAAGHTAAKFGFDVCLVKGSRGVKLERAVATLQEVCV